MRNARFIVIVAGLLCLLLINSKIMEKEALLEQGDLVFLQLAPVDPRSIMQGDYMALRFAVAEEVRRALMKQQPRQKLANQDGTVTVKLDENRVGRFARINDNHRLGPDERLLQFRIRDGRVKFATNAFFFQEGHAHYYENARFGEFRVDNTGELLLTGLRDQSLQRLGPSQEQ